MAKATKEKVNFWKEKLHEWEDSGLSRKEYCKKKGLIKSTADYWFRKLLKAGNEGSFVEINPSTLILDKEGSLKVAVEKKRKTYLEKNSLQG